MNFFDRWRKPRYFTGSQLGHIARCITAATPQSLLDAMRSVAVSLPHDAYGGIRRDVAAEVNRRMHAPLFRFDGLELHDRAGIKEVLDLEFDVGALVLRGEQHAFAETLDTLTSAYRKILDLKRTKHAALYDALRAHPWPSEAQFVEEIGAPAQDPFFVFGADRILLHLKDQYTPK